MPQVVPTALRALQVFEVFAREGRPLTNSEVARHLELADSSCSDLLFTLREAGYLMRMPKSRYFSPTMRLHDISRRMAAIDSMQAFAAEALEVLTKRTGESSLCAHLDGTDVKIFACQESSRALRYVLPPGTAVPTHATALGKALLGAMTATERDALIEQLNMEAVTDATLLDRESLRREVASGRERGWFCAQDEGAEGVTALGIAGAVNSRATALSIVGPTQRMQKNMNTYVDVILEAGREFF
ncbi:HTH-type transcriptional repressor AllR [Xylophilus ampelinus]|nr:HTH-type transcriptional repressor AllR [Xylophilus ampelinus]